MTDIANQLDTIKFNNFKGKIQSELDYFKEVAILTPFENGKDTIVEERIVLLEKVLNQPQIHYNTVQQQRDALFQEIDKYAYKKQWNKLPPQHKIVKIKEFLEANLQDQDLSVRKDLLEQLSDHAKNNRINTKKYVVYDPNKEKILLMPCLKQDEKDKTYKLDII